VRTHTSRGPRRKEHQQLLSSHLTPNLLHYNPRPSLIVRVACAQHFYCSCCQIPNAVKVAVCKVSAPFLSVAPDIMDLYDTLSDGASSRLTSPASRSPTPPSELLGLYPTPPSSDPSSMESSPAPDDVSSKRSLEDDANGKPAKRRKLSQPKPRTTDHLDLQSGEAETSQKEQFGKLLKVLYKKRKIVVVAGAGISVSAGSRSSSIHRLLCMF